MAFDIAKKKDNQFYKYHYHQILIGIAIFLVLLIGLIGVVFYQLTHRPEPTFTAMMPDKNRMDLIPYDQPNQLPNTILRWASNAATIAYTFDFYNYEKQVRNARPYFTEAGWQDYLSSVNDLINSVKQKQIFINGVVSGTPVITNQGSLFNFDYIWRVQIPFLVTYTGANSQINREFTVVITIVRVPTSVNPAGIGIDQFVMV